MCLIGFAFLLKKVKVEVGWVGLKLAKKVKPISGLRLISILQDRCHVEYLSEMRTAYL